MNSCYGVLIASCCCKYKCRISLDNYYLTGDTDACNKNLVTIPIEAVQEFGDVSQQTNIARSVPCSCALYLQHPSSIPSCFSTHASSTVDGQTNSALSIECDGQTNSLNSLPNSSVCRSPSVSRNNTTARRIRYQQPATRYKYQP